MLTSNKARIFISSPADAWKNISSLHVSVSLEDDTEHHLLRLYYNSVAATICNTNLKKFDTKSSLTALLDFIRSGGGLGGLETILLTLLIDASRRGHKSLVADVQSLAKRTPSRPDRENLLYDPGIRKGAILSPDFIASIFNNGPRAFLLDKPKHIFDQLSKSGVPTINDPFGLNTAPHSGSTGPFHPSPGSIPPIGSTGPHHLSSGSFPVLHVTEAHEESDAEVALKIALDATKVVAGTYVALGILGETPAFVLGTATVAQQAVLFGILAETLVETVSLGIEVGQLIRKSFDEEIPPLLLRLRL